MARPHPPFHLPAADQAALEEFTHTGCRPVRAVRRAQALLALATGIGQQAAGKAVGLSRQTVSELRQRYEAGGCRDGAGLYAGPHRARALDPAPARR